MPETHILIICESTDTGNDKKLIEELIEKHSLLREDEYKILPKNSIGEVKKYLEFNLFTNRRIVNEEIDSILIIVDADEEPKKRFKEIGELLSNNEATEGLKIQDSISSDLPNSTDKINVGVYLFPDRKNPGSLETLCFKSLKHEQLEEKLECINKYMECVCRIDRGMTENKKSKARYRIFVTTPNPRNYVDEITKNVDLRSDKFTKLKKFIKSAHKKE